MFMTQVHEINLTKLFDKLVHYLKKIKEIN